MDRRKIFLQEDVRGCVPVRLLNGRRKQNEKQADVSRRRREKRRKWTTARNTGQRILRIKYSETFHSH